MDKLNVIICKCHIIWYLICAIVYSPPKYDILAQSRPFEKRINGRIASRVIRNILQILQLDCRISDIIYHGYEYKKIFCLKFLSQRFDKCVTIDDTVSNFLISSAITFCFGCTVTFEGSAF